MSKHPFVALDAELAHCADGFAQTREPAPLEHGRRVMTALLGHPEWGVQSRERRGILLKQGGGLLLYLYRATNDLKVLEEAIAILTVGANLLDDGDGERAAMLANLGLATRMRAFRLADLEGLRQAVAIYRKSVEISHPGDIDLPKRYSNLGSALKAEFDLTGSEEAMRASIEAFAEAFRRDAGPDIASNLAMGLRDRHLATGSRADLEQAVALAREAVRSTSEADPGLPMRLNNLSMLARRYELDQQDSDAKEALATLDRLVSLTPEGDPVRGFRLFNLANMHRRMFGVTADRRAIALAARVFAEALAASDHGPDDMAMVKSAYADALSVLAELNGDSEQSERAIALSRDAVASASQGNVDRLSHLSSLAQCLQRHGRMTDTAEPLREAEQLLAGEANRQKTRPASVLLLLNQGGVAADLYALTADPADALRSAAVMKEGIRALQLQAVTGSFERANIELAAQSALNAVRPLLAVGALDIAVELLEQTRTARLNAEAMARQAVVVAAPDGGDTTRLRARIAENRAALERAAGDGVEEQRLRAEMARALEADLAALSAMRPGGGLGEPMDAASLCALAGALKATLVYVFAQDNLAAAILVDTNTIEAVHLPGLSDHRVRLHAVAPEGPGWFPAYRAAFGTVASDKARHEFNAVLAGTLEWLGAAFATPLWEALGEAPTRIVLLPAGELAALPLHAAPTPTGRPLSGELTCRYAPSATLLKLAAERPQRGGDVGVLADSLGDLPFSRIEAWAVSDRPFLGSEVTREAMISALGTAGRTHLSLHGRFEIDDPLESAFIGSDGTIRLGDLLAGSVEVASGATVIAAACESGLFDARVGAAEQIGFAASLMGGGASEVLTTLWPIHDLSTALVIARASSTMKDGQSFTQALDATIEWMRTASSFAVSRALADISDRLPPGELELRDLLEDAVQRLFDSEVLPFAAPRYWVGFALSGVRSA